MKVVVAMGGYQNWPNAQLACNLVKMGALKAVKGLMSEQEYRNLSCVTIPLYYQRYQKSLLDMVSIELLARGFMAFEVEVEVVLQTEQQIPCGTNPMAWAAKPLYERLSYKTIRLKTRLMIRNSECLIDLTDLIVQSINDQQKGASDSLTHINIAQACGQLIHTAISDYGCTDIKLLVDKDISRLSQELSLGLLATLGLKFKDVNAHDLRTSNLHDWSQVSSIDDSKLKKRLNGCTFTVFYLEYSKWPTAITTPCYIPYQHSPKDDWANSLRQIQEASRQTGIALLHNYYQRGVDENYQLDGGLGAALQCCASAELKCVADDITLRLFAFADEVKTADLIITTALPNNLKEGSSATIFQAANQHNIPVMTLGDEITLYRNGAQVCLVENKDLFMLFIKTVPQKNKELIDLVASTTDQVLTLLCMTKR